MRVTAAPAHRGRAKRASLAEQVTIFRQGEDADVYTVDLHQGETGRVLKSGVFRSPRDQRTKD